VTELLDFFNNNAGVGVLMAFVGIAYVFRNKVDKARFEDLIEQQKWMMDTLFELAKGNGHDVPRPPVVKERNGKKD